MREKVCHGSLYSNYMLAIFLCLIWQAVDSEYDTASIPHPYERAETVFTYERSQVWFKNLEGNVNINFAFFNVLFCSL